jgi:N-acyl-L-homoserine lactone synthetase
VIIIIPPHQHCQKRSLIEESFKVRYEVFIEELGWNIPGVKDGIERDQFDTPQTYYMMKLDENGAVIAGGRFVSTESSFLLKDIFPDLVDAEHQNLLIHKGFWEFSRLFISTQHRKKIGRQKTRALLCELLLGGQSFAMNMGIEGWLVVVEERIRKLYERLGWPVIQIGKVKKDGDTSILAAKMFNTCESYNKLCQRYEEYSGKPRKENFIHNIYDLRQGKPYKTKL